jgi:hypothetical protein
MSVQYLYVMSVPSGYVKVGVTGNERSRLSQVQVGNPEPVSLWMCIDPECDGVLARDLEQTVHWLLRGVRVCGEWFMTSPETAGYAVKVAWAKARYPALYDRWCRRQAEKQIWK